MSTLKLSTLSNLAGSQSTAVENAINGSAKAWVNFNGTGTVAIRASYNVSSITDGGAGVYIVNFTNAMPDANYSVVANTMFAGNSFGFASAGDGISTTSVYVVTFKNGAVTTAADMSLVTVAIHR